jgi:hypothetical protein
MGEAGRVGGVILVALALSTTAACRWPQANREISITVQLPPARPAVAKPAFSFDGARRVVTEEERPSILE